MSERLTVDFWWWWSGIVFLCRNRNKINKPTKRQWERIPARCCLSRWLHSFPWNVPHSALCSPGQQSCSRERICVCKERENKSRGFCPALSVKALCAGESACVGKISWWRQNAAERATVPSSRESLLGILRWAHTPEVNTQHGCVRLNTALLSRSIHSQWRLPWAQACFSSFFIWF